MVEGKLFVVEAIFDYECIRWERFGVFVAIMSVYNFSMRILGYPGW